MGVSRIGSVTVSTQSTASSGSFSVTVPAGAHIVIVSVVSYDGGVPQLSTTTLGAVTITQTNYFYDASGDFILFAKGMNPVAGVQTLSWSMTGTTTEKKTFFVAFYSGINTSSPIGAGGGNYTTVSGIMSTGILTASNGDAAVAATYAYPHTNTMSWTNAVSIAQNDTGDNQAEFGEKTGCTGSIEVKADPSANDAVLYGIILKSAPVNPNFLSFLRRYM